MIVSKALTNFSLNSYNKLQIFILAFELAAMKCPEIFPACTHFMHFFIYLSIFVKINGHCYHYQSLNIYIRLKSPFNRPNPWPNLILENLESADCHPNNGHSHEYCRHHGNYLKINFIIFFCDCAIVHIPELLCWCPASR